MKKGIIITILPILLSAAISSARQPPVSPAGDFTLQKPRKDRILPFWQG